MFVCGKHLKLHVCGAEVVRGTTLVRTAEHIPGGGVVYVRGEGGRVCFKR